VFIDNAGEAESHGAEVELSYVPLAGLTIDANAGMQRAEYTKFTATNLLPLSDKELPHAPHATASATTTALWLTRGLDQRHGDLSLRRLARSGEHYRVAVVRHVELQAANHALGLHGIPSHPGDVVSLSSANSSGPPRRPRICSTHCYVDTRLAHSCSGRSAKRIRKSTGSTNSCRATTPTTICV
jgi:hypothetical protein